jgi:hypothetical protein
MKEGVQTVILRVGDPVRINFADPRRFGHTQSRSVRNQMPSVNATCHKSKF